MEGWAASARWLCRRDARREDSRFEAVDGDHIRLVPYLKAEGERGMLEYQEGAVKERAQWLGRARAADQDMGGSLKGRRNCWWRWGMVQQGCGG